MKRKLIIGLIILIIGIITLVITPAALKISSNYIILNLVWTWCVGIGLLLIAMSYGYKPFR